MLNYFNKLSNIILKTEFLKLTLLYGTNSEITGLVDRFDWYITPVSNPDGYEYTWNSVTIYKALIITKSFIKPIPIFIEGSTLAQKSKAK